MRSPIDERSRGRGKRQKPVAPKGGKALLRLMTYLATRAPAMSEEVLAAVPTDQSVRTRAGLTATAARGKARQAKQAKTAPRTSTRAATKTFAKAILKAAAKVTRGQRKKPGRRPAARAMAAAPAAVAIWQPLGPSLIPNGQTYGTNRVDVIGRVAAIAIDPGKPQHMLCGAAGGGIWETTNGGATWAPRSDQMPSLAIGAIAFDPVNPKLVYAGSGEGNFYFNLGAGVYKSVDGGTTWTVIASAPFVGVGFFDLVVDRQNTKVLYAATTNGFYVSTNSGVTWSLRRAKRCWNISVDPAGGPTAEILAAFADGLFVSTSMGAAFSPISLPSTPATAFVRLAVDRVTAAPSIAYVFGAAGTTPHLWRRFSGTWTKITPLPALSVNQGWYDWYVAASPTNRAQVFIGAIDTYRGDLSGSTWTWTNITTQGANSIHPDQHCLTFAPGSPKTIYAGNDGGIYRSTNSGATWTALNKGLGITEIEFLDSDPTTAAWLIAGTQDNGTIRFTGNPVWDHIADGDGGDCAVNQLMPNEVYHSYYDVSLERSVNKGNTWTSLSPPNIPSLFYPPVEVFGSTVAIAATSLLVSRDNGATWTTLALGLAGDVGSAMEVPDLNTVFVGTRSGAVVKFAWTGASWARTNLTSPTPRFISSLIVDPGTPTRLWVTVSQVGGGSVYRSDDSGVTWVNSTGSLPAIPMNSVAVDSANGKHVWVAGDVGVYESVNTGGTWSTFSLGLPNAIAADLTFHKKDRKLICATRSRGVWMIAVP